MHGTGWSRRRLLSTGGALSAGVLLQRGRALAEAATKPLAKPLTPEVEEGPYYVDSELLRRDIREGRPGVPLHLRIAVIDGRTGGALPHAAVDIWHCDAMGIYSGYEKQSLGPSGPPGEAGPNGMPPRGPGDRPAGPPLDAEGHPLPPPNGFGPGGPPRSEITDNDRFMRGVQIADEKGVVDFLTIYPGWYQGRDTHIHVKVHVDGHDGMGQDKTRKNAPATAPRHIYEGGHVCFTGQIAFDDGWSDRIAKLKPYRDHNLQRTTLQEDGVFQGHAHDLLARLAQIDNSNLQAGVSANMIFTVDPAEIWKETAGMRGGFGGPPPRRP